MDSCVLAFCISLQFEHYKTFIIFHKCQHNYVVVNNDDCFNFNTK